MSDYTELDGFDTIDSSPTSLQGGRLPMLWRRKLSIILGAAIGLTLGYIHYQRQPCLYRSTAQVLVAKKRPDVVRTQTSDIDDYVEAQAKLIASPLIVKRAIDEGKLPTTSSGDPQGQVSALVPSLSGRVDGNILTVSSSGRDPEVCRLVLDAVITSYEGFLAETLDKSSEDTLKHITQKAEGLQKKLEVDGMRYQRLRESMPLLWQGANGTALQEERLAAIESKKYGLKLRRVEIESILEAVQNGERSLPIDSQRSPFSTRTNLSETVGAALERELVPLYVKEQNLLEEFGKDYPEVRSVRREIELKRELSQRFSGRITDPDGGDSHLEDYLQSLRDELEGITLSEKTLTELFENEYAQIQNLSKLDSEIKYVGSEMARTEEFHDALMDQLQQLNLGKDLGGYTTNIISPPTLGTKIAPEAQKILTTAAILGILAGFGLAYLVDITDTRFRSLDEIRHRLGFPVVGQVPLLTHGKEGRLNSTLDGRTLDPTLLDYRVSKSERAEAFRNVRLALLFEAHGEQHQVVQISSPNEGDGKSTIAANLAVAIAQAGKTTLLIDANLRTPRIHEIFGLSSSAGLTSVLAGEAILQDAIHDSGVAGLSILPCGSVPSNPAELLTSPRFKELMEEARGKYEHIVVDTSPLLDVSDPCVVMHAVDGVLLTVRVNRRCRFDAERAIATMGPLSAKLLGVVVNNMDGRLRPSPPSLLGPHNPFVSYRREDRDWRSASHGRRVGESRPGTTEPAKAQRTPPQDLTQLETSIQGLTKELRQQVEDAKAESQPSHETPLSRDTQVE